MSTEPERIRRTDLHGWFNAFGPSDACSVLGPDHPLTRSTELVHTLAVQAIATAAIPVRRGELLRASRETRLLIELLRDDGDVRAQGMARIHRLLSDGASPLYADSPRGTLAQTLIAATECMRDEH